MTNRKVKIPREVEVDRQKELEKKKKWYCFRCGAEISPNIKRRKDKYGDIKGRCPFCKRTAVFVDYYPSAENVGKHEKPPSTLSTTSTISTISTPSTNPSIGYKIKGLLQKERKPFQSIGRRIHNDVFYIGSVLEDGKEQLDCIITSGRKIYVDWGKKSYNEIKQDFGLNYRFSLFADCLDYWWSNASILKWLEEKYTVNIKDLFKKIVSINKKYMIYEDNRIHKYIALDIMRSYFFILSPANGRTYHHADPGSGKTNQLMVYRALSFNPMSSTDFSSASIYRFIESTSGTILIDDFDNLPDEQKSAIIQHIRTNYKKFKTVRADGNKSNRPYGYNSYSHLVFNNVYGLGNDRITPERVITIRLLKHKEAKDITVNPDDSQFNPIRDDLYVMTLQYCKDIKKIHDTLKVEELNSRDLELIKTILAIAKVIDQKLYDEILQWYKELIEQEKLKDLTDEWEYHLLKKLWNIIKEKQDKEIVQVFVKDIAEKIACDVCDPNSDNYNRTLLRLCSFVGGRLKGYLFRGGMTNGRTRYDIYKERVHQILDTKGWFKIVEGVERVEQKEPPIESFKQTSKSNKKPFEIVSEIKEYCQKVQKNGLNPSYTALVNNFDENTISKLIESGQLNKIPKSDCYRWSDN